MTATGQALRKGIGATLRAERERRHISLDAVARGTLVRQDFLEMIDADRLEELPAGAYAKGFIRSYVAYLGLEPKPFLRAYDERCGQPGPELARFAQQGVRVPPAAQKRAWTFAISSAALMLVLLGLLGAFRSNDEPSDLPASASAAVARVSQSAAPNAAGAVVRIEVTEEETWVEAEVDGQPVFANTLKRGEYETFKGQERIVLFLARGDAVRITANGEILSRPDAGSYRGIFTSKTDELPRNTPADAADAKSEATDEPDAATTVEVETPESSSGDAAR